MKRFVILLGIASLTSLAAADLNKVEAPAEPALLVIASKPVPLNKDNPKQLRVGELIYRGGLELRSPDKNFGGISGIRLWDATTVLAVSDGGSWISFRLIEKKGRLVGVKGIAIAPILDKDGNAGVKADRDVEAITRNGAAGACIALERKNGIWCYETIDPTTLASFKQKPTDDLAPELMLAWPANGGPETMAQTTTNDVPTLLVISEEAKAQGDFLDAFVTQEHQSRIQYLPPDTFKPTDADFIDGKQALVLHRFFSPASGVAASLGVLDLDNDMIGNGGFQSREIARLAPPLTVDNMEGISYIERKGRKFLYIVSDDNFSGLQRTLLMKFEWLPRKP
jgi:hypothetical protein